MAKPLPSIDVIAPVPEKVEAPAPVAAPVAVEERVHGHIVGKAAHDPHVEATAAGLMSARAWVQAIGMHPASAAGFLAWADKNSAAAREAAEWPAVLAAFKAKPVS